MKFLLVLVALIVSGHALELDNHNWDEVTAGKTVFIKFMAPWCGHCKKLAPVWADLMDRKTDVVVAKIDCTGTAKNICDDNGVKGYPTLKYGDPDDLQDYSGGRDLDTLKTFVDGLGPMCSLTNLDDCTAEQREEIEELQKLSIAELDAKLEEKKTLRTEAEATFKKRVDQLQKKYEKAVAKKEKALQRAKAGFLSAVLKQKIAEGKDEL